ncbi:MAG: hypothetical protein KDA80_14060 [Planctomycetaceae bacterium]|nr:hypothetical protein [Planctomycetaceae bacterium]
MSLSPAQEDRLTRFAQLLVTQQAAKVIVPAQQASTGFWFGGGNMVRHSDGTLDTVGRYRNFGDSRTGVGAGERGLELAIFRSTDNGDTFEKLISWSKRDLDLPGRPVLSIEGSALLLRPDGVELYVSTEKDQIGYPEGFESFLKPGTGVWTIDRLSAESMEGLKTAEVEPFVECRRPEHVHVKDPFLYTHGEQTDVLFCSHPFCWSSSNTGYIDRDRSRDAVYELFARGPAWDVAMTRGTAILDVPRIGDFADQQVSLVFYDGGECVRNLDEHSSAVKRPRGYSCEELGGVGYIVDGDYGTFTRLSRNFPLFISPMGTGCSRYIDVLTTPDQFIVTWQQSQTDLSQPLVMNRVPREQVEKVLTS